MRTGPPVIALTCQKNTPISGGSSMMIVYNSKSIDARILATFLRYHGRMVRISIFAGGLLASALDMRMGHGDLDFSHIYKAVIDALFESPGKKIFFKIEPLNEDKK